MSVRVAVASSDGKFINQHFGHAQQFLVFDLNDQGKFKFLELRENVPTCSGGNHTAGAMEDTFNLINDANIVLISQIGPGVSQFLLSKGIQPFMIPTYIDEALEKLAIRIAKLEDKRIAESKR